MSNSTLSLGNQRSGRSVMPGWVLILLFVADAVWHCWSVFQMSDSTTLISKFLLCFTLLLMSLYRLGTGSTVNLILLFCLAGDILLQPLDLNYADMSGQRPINFILGVICFCFGYGNLLRYYLRMNPGWRQAIKKSPQVLVINSLVTLVLLTWISLHSLAPAFLLPVIWIYSPVVVAVATMAVYARGTVPVPVFWGFVVGSHVILFSDTIIGLTVFVKITTPWIGNPLVILSTYIIGIFLVTISLLSWESKIASIGEKSL